MHNTVWLDNVFFLQSKQAFKPMGLRVLKKLLQNAEKAKKLFAWKSEVQIPRHSKEQQLKWQA